MLSGDEDYIHHCVKATVENPKAVLKTVALGEQTWKMS